MKLKEVFYSILAVTLVLSMVLGISEVVLRMMNYKPWQMETKNISITPNQPFFEKDSLLGFKTSHGLFELTIDQDFRFTCTNRPNGLRMTSPLWSPDTVSLHPQIWIFGGSYTYGWSVNDEETFCWLLQEKFPEYEIVNFGIPAYGTLQSLLQFENALVRQTTPEMVILVYASFHDMRNVSSRSWRKMLAPYNQLGPLHHPYALLENEELIISNKDFQYRPWPLMRQFALVHFLERRVNALEMNLLSGKEVTNQLIHRFHRVCRQHNLQFAMATIGTDDATLATLHYCTEKAIAIFDMTVDMRLPENTNVPYDSHPSAKAHREYAEGLGRFLKENQRELNR